MSQTPRHIKTDRSLNRPTERRAEKAPASRPVQPAQPDFFAEEKPAPAEPPRRAGGSGGAKPPRRSTPAGGNEPPRRRKKKKKTPLWLPLAVTLAVLAVISGVVVYAVGMVGRVEENLRPEEDAPSITEEIQTLEEYKGDVVNILVCGIDYEEGRNYSNDPTSNDGMTDMILYCQFDIKGGALRMLQIPRNSLVATKGRKVALSNGKTYAATNYQINSVALSNGGSVAALAEVIYDQYKLPVDYYVTVDMQALVEMVDNFGGIEVYIPHDMSFAGSALKQGYRNLDGASAEFFVRCRHGQGYSNSDIDRLNMQRYFYAGLFKRVRSMGITDVLNQLPLVFNNYIHTDMDLTTIAKMLVSFTRIDSANIMLAQTPVFMGVPNVGVTDTFDGYSCVVPDAGSIAELLNTYFRNYTGPVSASELTQMLKGGVIMDVTTPEQARIAEAAGACAVMALERIPADIRAAGGVSRMSDPKMIKGIQEAVSIPVMAKCRIGHFAEAQILQAIEIDYIDESEVLSPADDKYHIDKTKFDVPFVCGAKDLGEALRRINEGASMIRTKGEPGTGDVVQAVRHMRMMQSEIRRIGSMAEDELYETAKSLAVPFELVKYVHDNKKLPVVNFAAGGVATPADAALMMQLGAEGVFVGSGIFKSGNPEKRAAAIVKAVTNFTDAKLLAELSEDLGEAMVGINEQEIALLMAERGK